MFFFLNYCKTGSNTPITWVLYFHHLVPKSPKTGSQKSKFGSSTLNIWVPYPPPPNYFVPTPPLPNLVPTPPAFGSYIPITWFPSPPSYFDFHSPTFGSHTPNIQFHIPIIFFTHHHHFTPIPPLLGPHTPSFATHNPII